MTVRAKFYVSEVKESLYQSQNSGTLTTIKLMPVVSGSEENKQFYRWSPSGSIDLGTVNPAVVEQFHIGDEFYIDFTPAKVANPETVEAESARKAAENVVQ
jgi:hypothetical protein